VPKALSDASIESLTGWLKAVVVENLLIGEVWCTHKAPLVFVIADIDSPTQGAIRVAPDNLNNLASSLHVR
jgi:hypothetical protein